MGVIENMKDIADLIKKAGDLDLYRKIVESEGEVIDLTRRNRSLEARVEELEATLKLKKSLTFKEPFYWLDGDATPHCPACWEGTQKAVHVTFVSDRTDTTYWDCPHCKHGYKVEKDRSVKHDGPVRRMPYGGGRNSWMGR